MSKSDRLKARLPRGFVDRGARTQTALARMLETIRGVYELYGFEALETPAIEYTDALGKFLPDQDRPNEGVFSFQDDDGQWLSLRYDLTAPLARYVAENFDALPKPYRSYRCGYVFRNEKPGPGRFRQFLQFDADTVGASGPAADAEMCMMMADTLEALGLQRGQYVIKVSSRKLLDGVMEAIGLDGEANLKRRLTVLRAIDKADKFEWPEIAKLLGPGRKDDSGDFTKGAGLDDQQINAIKCFLDTSVRAERTHVQTRMSSPDGVDSFSSTQSYIDGLEDIQSINKLVQAAGYMSDRIRPDFSVVRGLEYYTGTVFEAELLFEVPNEKGQHVVFGSVGGGGRYDGLIGRFRPESVPATGFSIGVSRLLAALEAVKSSIITSEASHGPVVVLVMDQERLADYQGFVAQLRKAGIRAELYLGSSGLKAQMKYADKRGSPCVILQGSDEKAQGLVQIKDLIEGKKAAEAIASHAEYKEARPAQISCPEGELVEKVHEILERHGLKPS